MDKKNKSRCWRCGKAGGYGKPLKPFERAIPSREVVPLCTNPWGGCYAIMRRTHPGYIEAQIKQLDIERQQQRYDCPSPDQQGSSYWYDGRVSLFEIKKEWTSE